MQNPNLSRPLIVAAVVAIAICGPTASFGAGPSPDEDAGSSLIFAGNDFRTLMSQAMGAELPLKGAPIRPLADFADQPMLKSLAPDQHPSASPTVIRDLALSPDGRWLAIQVDMGVLPMTWVMRTADRKGESIRPLVATGYGFLLGWHPDSNRVLYKALDLDVVDPGLWLVRVADGKYRRLEIPELKVELGLMAAAVSPDGELLAYAFTQGLGTGSEIWLTELEGTFRRRISRQPNAVVGTLQWSSDSRQLAFNTLYDSPVPFAEAGLWVYDRDRDETRWLGLMDGGHGEEPVWSEDGEQLFFVARENLEDAVANRDPEALVSSIRAVEVATGRQQVLVEADGARQIDLVKSADGRLLFASDRAGGNLEVWALDPAHKAGASRLTFDGMAKRHPALIAPASR